MFNTKRTVAQTVLMARAAMAISAPCRFIRLPTAMISRKARKGSTSMIPAVSTQNPLVTPASTTCSASVARIEIDDLSTSPMWHRRPVTVRPCQSARCTR